MPNQTVTLYGSDKRLVLADGEAIRQPTYMAYTAVAGASADTSTDVITSTAHGLIDGDKVMFLGGSVPGGITAGNYYFVRDKTTNTFKVEATLGGGAVNITSAGSGWTYVKQLFTTIRIGVLISFDNATVSLSGTPRLAMGVCKGNTNGYGAASSEHVVGVHTGASAWTHNSGTPNYFSFSAQQFRPFKRVGASTTETSQSTSWYLAADNTIRNAFIVEIIKANSSWSFSVAAPTASAGAQSTVTDTEFQQMMDLSSLSSISSVKSNYGQLYSAVTLAVNENTNGVLDRIFVRWGLTTPQLCIGDVKHRIVN